MEISGPVPIEKEPYIPAAKIDFRGLRLWKVDFQEMRVQEEPIVIYTAP